MFFSLCFNRLCKDTANFWSVQINKCENVLFLRFWVFGGGTLILARSLLGPCLTLAVALGTHIAKIDCRKRLINRQLRPPLSIFEQSSL